jgi:hypothetical protein
MAFQWLRYEKFHFLRTSTVTTIRISLSELQKISLILFSWSHIKSFRLLDVIHRRADRDNTLELFLVFEYLERDLADYITHLPSTALIPTHQIQVHWMKVKIFTIFIPSGCSFTETFKRAFKWHRFPSFAQNYSSRS